MKHLYNEFEWPFEISGFGGDYEEACRNMTKAGAEWLRANPEALGKWRADRDEFKKRNPGKPVPVTDSEREFDDAIANACPDCTGAMFGAAKAHAIAIFDMGWDAYVKKVMTARTYHTPT